MVALGSILNVAKKVGGGVVDAIKGAYTGVKNKGNVPGVTLIPEVKEQATKKKYVSGSAKDAASLVGAASVGGVVASLFSGSNSSLDNQSKNDSPVDYDYTNIQETVNFSSSDINITGDGNTVSGGVAESISKPSSYPSYSPETSQGSTGSTSEGLTSILGNVDAKTVAAVGLGIGGVYLLGKYLGKPSYKTYQRRYY